jgi:hypothetical protein
LTVAVGRGEYWFRKSIKIMLKLTITNNCNNFNTLVKGDYCLTLNEQFFQLYHGINMCHLLAERRVFDILHNCLACSLWHTRNVYKHAFLLVQIMSGVTLLILILIWLKIIYWLVFTFTIIYNCVICQILYALLTDGTC